MNIYFRLAIFGITCLNCIGLCAPISAQVARTELHAIPTLTLSDRQFLLGEKNGTSVTIAGALRVPHLGTDRLPAVILVHGSGGIGGNVDRWSHELNSFGVATFVTDSFTAAGYRARLPIKIGNRALYAAGREAIGDESCYSKAVEFVRPAID